MIDIIQTLSIIIATSGVTLLLLRFYLMRAIPRLLDDVGVSIGEAFTTAITTMIKDPMSKRAMSILGKKSGQVRHDAAAENALAEGLLNNIAPEIRIVLDKIDPDIIENYGAETVLNLAAKYAPMLQRFLPGGLESLGNIIGNKEKSEYKSRF